MNITIWILLVFLKITDPTGEESFKTVQVRTDFSTRHACEQFKGHFEKIFRDKENFGQYVQSSKFLCTKETIKAYGAERRRLQDRQDRVNKWKEDIQP